MKDDADLVTLDELDRRHMTPERLDAVKRRVAAARPDLVRRIAVAKAARSKGPKVATSLRRDSTHP